MALSRNYEPVPKADTDGDSDVTLTNRQTRRGVPGFLKRNLAAITITGLLVVLMMLVVAVITSITVEPFRQILVVKTPVPLATGHTGHAGDAVYPVELEGQRQCLPTKSRTTYSCGNSTTEAEERGCAYDPLAGCWLHKECPRDFTHEFATFNNGQPFVYYYDEAMTQQMKDYDEVGRNPDRYWTSIREHLVHCLYLLRRGHEVHMRGDRLDTMLGDLEHVDHCTNMLADWLRRDDPVLDHVGTSGFTHCFIMPPKRIAIVTSSTRRPRLNPTITQYVYDVLSADPIIPTNHSTNPDTDPRHITLEILDLSSQNLPLYDESIVPASLPAADPTPHYSKAHTRAWSAVVRQYDAFIFVTPQYNWSIPASLKNALDYLFFEWVGKPAGIVSYGSRGGGKAAEHLRGVLTGLRMRVVGTAPGLSVKFTGVSGEKVELDERDVAGWTGAGIPGMMRNMGMELVCELDK
ncbi:unnamed protein product [Penicillium olsonii]|nr:unnamed protein product [Penicillium olsonii]